MIQVVCRAMNILELLGTNANKEFTLTEICAALNLDKGTCTNILKTLANRGFVQQRAPRTGYKLGYTIYKMTNNSVDNDELTKVARDDVYKLGDLLNETAILSVIRNDMRVTLISTSPDRELMVRSTVSKSVYSANTGRVILAHYTPQHLEKFIIRKGLPQETEWPDVALSSNPSGELANQLAEIRKKGFSIMHDRNGIDGFAAPLFKGGHIVGSVGVYLPNSRVNDMNKIVSSVMDAAAKINRKIVLTENL